MSALLLVVLQAPLPSHNKLESSMFWVGALMAFLPIVIVVALVGFSRWNQRRTGSPEQ